MANISITKIGESIAVDFGDYYSASNEVDSKKTGYDRRNIMEINIIEVGTGEDIRDIVLILMRKMNNIEEWRVTYDPTETDPSIFIIDTVEGVAPSSTDDLFTKLNNLR